jgi:hypothetical protein
MTEAPWEDSLLERKLESDLKDLLKTLVAFSNSVRPGHKATILLGERDDGSAQGVTDPDQIQRTVRKECERIYPPIVWQSRVYEKERSNCVQVDIEYSGETPHFGGPAWIRKGSETVKASDEVFQRLIDIRLDKVRELAKWLGKKVTVEGDAPLSPQDRFMHGNYHPRWRGSQQVELCFVNSFWATFRDEQRQRSEPLGKLQLSWDDAKNSLKVLVSD